MRIIELRLRVPFAGDPIRVACAALTTCNRLYLRAARLAGERVPELYRSGVRYFHPRGPEIWETIPEALERGTGDCKVLGCWRAAELREQGIDARAVPVRVSDRLFHIVVQLPDGTIEDPSKRLGMGQHPRIGLWA